MPQLIPVDHDPFSQSEGLPKLVPIDHDPFSTTTPSDSGFFGRVRGDVEKRGENIGQESVRASMRDQERQKKGEESPLDINLERNFQQTAQGVGLIGDVAGEAMSSAAKPIVSAIPQPFKDKASDVIKKLTQSSLGQKAIEALKAGGNAWSKFSKEHPDIADDIGGAFTVATASFPEAKFSSAAGGAGSGLLGKAGEFALKVGRRQKEKEVSDFVQDLVMPDKTKSVRLDEVGRTSKGKDLLKTNAVENTAREKDLAAEVVKVPGVSKDKTLQDNYNFIDDENSREAQGLVTRVKANDVAISPQELQAESDQIYKNLKGKTYLSSTDSSTKDFTDRAMQEMGKYIQKNGSTASGLLQSRKDFDHWINNQNLKFFDAKFENMKYDVAREIRTAANNLVEKKVPSTAQSLAKQNKLYDALKNMKPKVEKEGNDVISRTLQRMQKYSPVKGEWEKGVTLGNITAGGVAAPASAAKFAYKSLTGPDLKIAAGHALKIIDATLQGAKDPKLAKELRLDRMVLLGIIKDTGDAMPKEHPQSAAEALQNPDQATQALQPPYQELQNGTAR